ncbi:hypothetical protein NDU88_003274 [Pleurodeles waltl]|uniref:Uncharacterized protein n=1 Tax=Pleurodeles waltl TaxID=8319 RepID=A0AAV7MAK5_PLEWA|nr:hypothetical protein NDU88_003274 [Pleurodeles waltl]
MSRGGPSMVQCTDRPLQGQWCILQSPGEPQRVLMICTGTRVRDRNHPTVCLCILVLPSGQEADCTGLVVHQTSTGVVAVAGCRAGQDSGAVLEPNRGPALVLLREDPERAACTVQ